MRNIRRMRNDLKYVKEKLIFFEGDVYSYEEYEEILLGKKEIKDALFNLIVAILQNRPPDIEHPSLGAYTTVYSFFDNEKIAREIAETDKKMKEVIEYYLE